MPPPTTSPNAQLRQALVVDDEPDSAEILARMLAREGWAVHRAASGREGLEAIARDRPELVVLGLDLARPRMSGFAFLDAIGAVSQWRDIPVVVVTARDLSPGDRARIGATRRTLQKGSVSRIALRGVLRRAVV